MQANETSMTKLSIIVPVYNVEKYIRPCIESIFRQGIDDNDFEVIIVNDGTKDNSMGMITDIISQHDNIIIINQDNQGVSIARNNGYKIAKGKYIQFMDSDDLLIDNSLPYLLNNALTSNAELVIADFIKMTDDEITLFNINTFHQKDGTIQEETGKQLLNHPLYFGYSCVWRTLYRKDFLDKNNIRFIPDIYFEDVLFTRQCFLNANSCLRVNWLLYIYRIGHQSIINSSFSKEKGTSYCIIIKETWELSQNKDLSSQLQQKIRDDIFSYFSMFIYLLSSSNTIPYSEKMGLINDLKELVPDLSFNNGVKQKVVNFLYRRVPSIYIKLRILYAKNIQDLLWEIRDTIRNIKTIKKYDKYLP